MTDRNSEPDTQPTGVFLFRWRLDTAEVKRVEPREVLDRLRMLQVQAWGITSASGTDYLGPAAEDFHEVFEVGADADDIDAGDADGVAMAAIQGLAERLDEQQPHIDRQDRRIEQQQAQIDEHRTDLEALRDRLEALQVDISRLEWDERRG
jgi:uncharacterized coiled-coil protein SlyX